MYILTVFVYTILICMLPVSRHSSLCVNENPTTRSLSVGLHTQCWRQNQCHHHLNRPHLARLCRSGSQMRACESHVTFCSLDDDIAFLRTSLSWTLTVLSTFGCSNLFLCLLCIHPSILHICSEAESLVMTEHNFFANHTRLSNKTRPCSSMTPCVNVFTQFC